MMADESMQLKLLLSLPEKDTWVDKKDEPIISDSGETHTHTHTHTHTFSLKHIYNIWNSCLMLFTAVLLLLRFD